MTLQRNSLNNTQISVNAKFANLKYEQLLGEKYFVETCFSKKDESGSNKQKLADMFVTIRFNNCK